MPKVNDSYLEAHREKILDAAMICFSRKGFTETTIPDICREAQLSTGAVYRYFKNKDDLIEASVQKHRAERSKRLTMIEEKNAPEMLDRLYQLQVLRLLSPEPDNRAKIMIHSFGEALTNPQVSRIVKGNWEEMSGHFEKIILKAQEQGYINPAFEARAVAVMINAIHDGLLLQKVIVPESSGVIEKVLEVMRSLFVFGKGWAPEGKSREG